MKVALYLRMAHQNDDSVERMAEHERYLRTWAVEHGHEVVDVFRDFGPGTTLRRPGLQSLFDKMNAKCFEGVLTRDSGRLVSGMKLVLPLAERFRKAGIKVIEPHWMDDAFETYAQCLMALEESLKQEARHDT